MKTLSLFVSVLVFFTSGFYLTSEHFDLTEINNVIYLCLLALLLIISIVGILINFSLIVNSRNKIEEFFMKIDLSGK